MKTLFNHSFFQLIGFFLIMKYVFISRDEYHAHPSVLFANVTLIPLRQGDEESFILKSCTRRKTDSIEKRFCFDVEAVDR